MNIFDDKPEEENQDEFALTGTFNIIPPDGTNIGPELAAYGILPDKLFHNRYRLINYLGKGLRGYVLLFADTTKRRSFCALKIIYPAIAKDPKVIKRVQRAVQLCRELNHKNIVGIQEDGCTENSIWYYKMDYIEGYSLSHILKEENYPELDYQQILYILHEIANAMVHAHGAKIIHRDIKPSNILIDVDGNVVLTDFSLARALEEKEGLSATGELVGDPRYMAPEIFRGEPIGQLADIYSLGIVAYEMATGQCPFEETDRLRLVNAHAPQELPKLFGKAKKYPKAMYQFIERCTGKNGAQRFQDAKQVVMALEDQIRGLDSGSLELDMDLRIEVLRRLTNEKKLKTGHPRYR